MKLELLFDHAHHRCADLEAAVAFYQRMLDAEIVKRSDYNGRVIVTLRVGNILFCLSPAPGDAETHVEENRRRLGIYHLAFLVPNLEKAVAECKRRGATFVVENLTAAPTRKVAFFEAPDGMQVELMEDFPEAA